MSKEFYPQLSRLFRWLFLALVVAASANGQSSIFFEDGTSGKRACWHPITGPNTYSVTVDVSTGHCGAGSYEIQWGDGTTVAIDPARRRYAKTYSLASFRNNAPLGILTFNIFVASTREDCFDLAVARVTINKIPIPIPLVTAACENVESTFTNNSQGRNSQPLTWSWEFSDGVTSPNVNVTRRFDDPDREYSVTLTVKSDVCPHTETSAPVSFRLKKLPETHAEVRGLTGSSLCFTEGSDSTIILDASGSRDATRFNWNIAGGDFSIEEIMRPDSAILRIKIEELQSYEVNITAENECGVDPRPNAVFRVGFESLALPEIDIVRQVDGCEELTYRLTNPKPQATYWLNDTPLGHDQEVVLAVSETEYIVRGRIENACGIEMDADTFYVHAKAPVAITSLPLDTTVCLATESLELIASRQGGRWSTEGVQLVGGRALFHPNNTGDFVVSYQIGTGLCLAADSRRVKVINELAQASIGLDETDLRCSPARVLFSNRSIGSDAGFSLWNFGGGDIETSADTISHVYTALDNESDFVVRLKVRNACGFADATRTIKILPNTIKPLFSFPPGVFCPDVAIAFEDATVPTPTNWTWDFGDGVRSNISDPQHRFSAPGTYAVKLDVANQCASASVTHEINVQVPPTPDFAVETGIACAGKEVSFVNKSDIRYGFEWDFGDGSAVETVSFSPNHTYASEGSYQVRLTIFDGSRECSSKQELPVNISPNVQASFSVEVADEACEPALVKFVNNTQGADTWQWEFSDGETTRTSQVKEPLIPFTRGQYTFHLVASREGACPAVAEESEYFDLTPCNVEIPEAFTPNGDLHGDRYTLFGNGIDRILFMRVRNRWSEVVYEMKDVPAGSQSPGESWDGTKDGRNLPPDMYVFEAKVRYRDQTESEVIRGNFYLVR